MEEMRYLHVQPTSQDEERDVSILSKLTKELMDDILKTKETQRNFFASLKEADLSVASVKQKILELAPHDEMYMTIVHLYTQFRNGKPLSATYIHNPLEFAKANKDFSSWRAYVMSLLKE
ncbi:hypothetical protein PPTG_21927 [Phytophthora nicotianae INRA-310]|nr:hypothetical protein PPTG_21927 [Phytophthora nicotianae INRA-310]ETM55391.1 hypothetical protein L914_01377 [Phytophthora nicotianae]ETN15344.1 hypothetical protein PPTG_21927 [Phytophthora nicotianae INRA-310]